MCFFSTTNKGKSCQGQKDLILHFMQDFSPCGSKVKQMPPHIPIECGAMSIGYEPIPIYMYLKMNYFWSNEWLKCTLPVD